MTDRSILALKNVVVRIILHDGTIEQILGLVSVECDRDSAQTHDLADTYILVGLPVIFEVLLVIIILIIIPIFVLVIVVIVYARCYGFNMSQKQAELEVAGKRTKVRYQERIAASKRFPRKLGILRYWCCKRHVRNLGALSTVDSFHERIMLCSLLCTRASICGRPRRSSPFFGMYTMSYMRNSR
jgi:hypothetical protein